MKEISRSIFVKCPGCGVDFQRTNSTAPGYLPDNKEPGEGVICKRCFQLRHYGQLQKADIRDAKIKKEIRSQFSECSALMVVLDITEFELSTGVVSWVGSFDKKKPLFVVVNKCDLLASWIGYPKIRQWVASRLGLPIETVYPISARKATEIRDLQKILKEKLVPGDKLLIIGTTNVGKSSLLKGLTGDRNIMISRLPGTTIGITEIKDKNSIGYVDIPGLKEENPWLPLLCPQCLVSLIPKKKMNMKNLILHTGQTLMFGGLAWIDIVDCGERDWVRIGVFASDTLSLHSSKTARIPELIEPHIGGLLTPPCASCWDVLSAQQLKTTLYSAKFGQDIVIPGCGWIGVYSDDVQLRVNVPSMVNPVVRSCLVPHLADRRR